MQPNTTLVKSKGDLGGHKIDMKIDANSIEHIMSVLTDLYSDPIGAVVREYSTNALDSHKESGQTRPVEIVMPSQFDPNFRVKDYGVGLSVNDVESIYSQYGASTKRGTDDQTGMLGLGCKSGLTYADQFIVTAVKNGIKVSVVVSRTEKGTGVMETLDTVSTDEPNGVEITIPVKAGDYRKFIDYGARFYVYWPKGSVVIDGNEPAHFADDKNVVKVTDEIFLVRHMHEHKIVMGDVAYPVPFEKINFNNAQRTWNENWAVVAFVPMGSVNFTPSREQLHMTRLTLATLKGIGESFDAAIVKRVEESIANCATHREAWVKSHEWKNIVKFTNANILYKGAPIPTNVEIKGTLIRPGVRNGIHNHGGKHFGPTDAPGLFITGFPADTYGRFETSSSQRTIVSKWIDEVATKYFGNYMLVAAPVDNVWLGDDVTNVTWEEIKASTKALRSAEYRKAAGTYKIYDPTKQYVDDIVLPASDKIAWMSYKYEQFSHSKAAHALPGYYIVLLPENRKEKFWRDFPEVKHVRTVISENFNTTLPAKTKWDVMRDSVNTDTLRALAQWDASKIKDPKVKELVGDCKKALKSDWDSKHAQQVSTAANFGIVLHQDETTEKAMDPKNTLAVYPLIAVHFNHYGRFYLDSAVSKDHIYEYINLIYEGIA